MSKSSRANHVLLEGMNAGRPVITADFDHLVAVIDATYALQETASDACIIEIRRKIETMAVDFSPLVIDIAAWDRFMKDSKEYNTARMEAFSKHISSREMAMHAAALNFTESSKGDSYCDCQAFRIVDESTVDGPRYFARYSGMYNQLWTCFLAAIKQDVEEATTALYADNAAAELRRIYGGIVEAQNAEKDKGTGKDNGGDADVQLPPDSPPWLQDAFNACNSLRRAMLGAYHTDPEAAELIVPPITVEVQNRTRDIQAAIRNAVMVEAAEAKTATQ